MVTSYFLTKNVCGFFTEIKKDVFLSPKMKEVEMKSQ